MQIHSHNHVVISVFFNIFFSHNFIPWTYHDYFVTFVFSRLLCIFFFLFWNTLFPWYKTTTTLSHFHKYCVSLSHLFFFQLLSLIFFPIGTYPFHGTKPPPLSSIFVNTLYLQVNEEKHRKFPIFFIRTHLFSQYNKVYCSLFLTCFVLALIMYTNFWYHNLEH